MRRNQHIGAKTTPQEYRTHILENITVDDSSGCWNWSKCKNENGYGIIKYLKANARASRVAFWAFVDNSFKIKNNSKELVCHKCDNKSCVNPEHLFLGSHRDNMEDAELKKSAKLTPLKRREQKRIASINSYYKNIANYERKDVAISAYEISKINLDIQF